MKKLFLLLLVCFPLFSIAQSIDTIVITPIYKSYYNKGILEPLYVCYQVPPYHKSQRVICNDDFYDEPGPANYWTYYKTGFDRGHLAPAEDFSSDCAVKHNTYRYWNCIPQYPNLNRGIWKSLEVKIRGLSSSRKLLVLDGGTKWYSIPNSKLIVPGNCWKVCISLDTSSILYCRVYTNLKLNNSYVDLSISDLVKFIGYTPVELSTYLTR